MTVRSKAQKRGGRVNNRDKNSKSKYCPLTTSEAANLPVWDVLQTNTVVKLTNFGLWWETRHLLKKRRSACITQLET